MLKTLEDVKEEVELIRDKLDRPIDEKIKPLVIGLRFHGIETTSSCEGHCRGGHPYPWVSIKPGQLYKTLKLIAKQNRTNLPEGLKNNNTWVLKPVAGEFRIIPEDKSLPLEILQRNAVEFGAFIQQAKN